MSVASPSPFLDAPWFLSTQPFLVGGIAGCFATTIVQPVDCVKVRLQLLGEGVHSHAPSALATARSIIRAEGVKGLYAGISAGYVRQLVYGSARLGLFRNFSNKLRERNNGKQLSVWQKVFAGLSSGAVASFIGNPADVALADATLPTDQRRHYKGVVNAISRTAREDGMLGLWRGSTPTVVRATVLNAAMLATADQVKETLAHVLGGEHSTSNTVISSAISGVTAAVASLPFDMIKTRIQKQKAGANGLLPYSGFIDCAKKIVAKEGFSAFYMVCLLRGSTSPQPVMRSA